MNSMRRQSLAGMVLIEAMVALVVLAIGVLGIAKLNSYFIEVSGQSKARAQAVQLAETKLAELRSLMVKTQFDDEIVAGSDTAYGYSADGVQATAFQRSWTTAASGAEGKEITVNVSWVDRFNKNQQVSVNSVVAWNDPAKAVALIEGTAGAGSHAKTPTGRAKLGEGTMTVDAGITPNSDGLRQQQGDDGKWRLVRADGVVLLTATEEDERFSEIAGNVYIDQASLSSISNNAVYIVISDASFCSMTPAKTTAPTAANALSNLNTGSVFKYFSYRCYLGAAWYGNIGVVRVDNANTNDRVCVGDPAVSTVSSSVKSDNRHPSLGTARMYRGYKANGAGYLSTGIGINSSGQYSQAIYDGHDFLLTRITGNPSDADCATKLRLYDGTAPYQPFSTCGGGSCSGEIYDAQIHTNTDSLPATETAYLNGGNTIVLGNPGKFFCMTTTCPDPLPNEPAPQITIHVIGTISRSPATGGGKPTLSTANPSPELTTSSGSCLVTGGTGNNAYNYDCSFTGLGFTGGTWSGTMRVNLSAANEYLCSAGVNGGTTTTPPPAPGPSAPVQDYTFNFTNQSVDAGNTTMNFKIGTTLGDC